MSDYIKHGIPDQQGLIERPRLLQQLTQVTTSRVTILSAPPGSGKTTLVAQFAHQVECHLIWHTITSFQLDFRVMLLELIDSLSRFVPDTRSLHNQIEQPPELIAAGMSKLIAEHTAEPFILVLDDWHRFKNHHPANQWLKTFIRLMPVNCHLLVSGRTVPPLNLIEMISRREVLAIQQQDLYFTEAEVFHLAGKLQANITPADVKLIWDKLQGWAAGTVLSLQPGSQSLLQQLPDDHLPSETLFQSIAGDMLKQQAPDVKHFLQWTSTVEKFDSSICGDNVLRIPEWEFMLGEVVNQNLFIQKDGTGYRYHELFREFLQNNFRLNQPGDYQEAHRRVASWYERRSITDRAIIHYIRADKLPEASRLLESIAQSYFIQGRIESLRQFNEEFPATGILTPAFDYVRARIALVYDGDSELAIDFAERALDGFEKQGNTLWVHRTRYHIANIIYFRGSHQEALEICEKLIDVVKDNAELHGLVSERLAMCWYRKGKPAKALQYIEPAIEELEQHSGWLELSTAYQNIELIYRALGMKEKADFCLKRLIHLRRALNNREELATALNNIGYQYYVDGDYQAARDSFEEGLQLVRLMEGGRSKYFLSASLGDLARDCGYYDEAREHYQQTLDLIEDNEPYVRCEALTHLATLYRWQGRSEAALTCADQAMSIARSHNMLNAYKSARLEELHIKLQPYNAGIIAQELRDQGDAADSVPVLVLQLRLAVFLKETDSVQQILAKLRDLYSKHDDLSFFFAELVNNRTLTAIRQQILLENDALTGHLKRLLEASDPKKRSVIIPITPPTSSLEVYTLGTEIIRQDDRRVAVNEWQSKQAREMFFFFACQKPVRRDDLCLIFWEDKDPEKAIAQFHQLISRIRHVIGGQSIIFDEETLIYRLNPDIDLWCDVLRLDTLLEEAQKLGSSSVRALDLWSKATTLLTGEFLPDFDRAWIDEMRSKYAILTVKAWMELGHCYITQNDYHTALQAFQTAARYDDLHEEAYRWQMICHARLGERRNVTHVYNLLRKKLREELDTPPSSDTDQLYINLIG